MREKNGTANGGGRSWVSQHVSQNAEVAVVTGGQSQGGGRQSHGQASGPEGCHKPSSDRCSPRRGEEKAKTANSVSVKYQMDVRYVDNDRCPTTAE